MDQNQEKAFPIDYCALTRKANKNNTTDDAIAMMIIDTYVKTTLLSDEYEQQEYPFKDQELNSQEDNLEDGATPHVSPSVSSVGNIELSDEENSSKSAKKKKKLVLKPVLKKTQYKESLKKPKPANAKKVKVRKRT